MTGCGGCCCPAAPPACPVADPSSAPQGRRGKRNRTYSKKKGRHALLARVRERVGVEALVGAPVLEPDVLGERRARSIATRSHARARPLLFRCAVGWLRGQGRSIRRRSTVMVRDHERVASAWRPHHDLNLAALSFRDQHDRLTSASRGRLTSASVSRGPMSSITRPATVTTRCAAVSVAWSSLAANCARRETTVTVTLVIRLDSARAMSSQARPHSFPPPPLLLLYSFSTPSLLIPLAI